MNAPVWTIHPAGDRSLVVVFHDNDPAIANKHAGLLAKDFQLHHPIGVHTIVSGMVSVALHYAPEKVFQHAISVNQAEAVSPYDWLVQELQARIDQPRHATAVYVREIEIPVCYGNEYGPDLIQVAERSGISPQEVIDLHTAHAVDVFMLGFAPGHPYIGRFSEQLTVGRRSSPRTEVPTGSIGLANRQSVIYPMLLPGGWHLIGRTPLTMFDAGRQEPSLLLSGDKVKFVSISAKEYELLAAEARRQG